VVCGLLFLVPGFWLAVEIVDDSPSINYKQQTTNHKQQTTHYRIIVMYPTNGLVLVSFKLIA